MVKKLEQGFLHPLNLSSTPSRILEGKHFTFDQRRVNQFRAVINAVMASAEVQTQEAVENGELQSEEIIDTVAETLIAAAKTHGIFDRGDTLAYEGASIIYVGDPENTGVYRPSILRRSLTVLGGYLSPSYNTYAAAKPEEIEQYINGGTAARCIIRQGGVLLLEDATVFVTESGQPRHEYENVMVPLNEPGIKIYQAVEHN